MNSIKMSYRGFEFNANPSTVKTEFSKKTQQRVVPFKLSRTSVTCTAPAVITGKGKFCGKGAGKEAQGLYSVFKKDGAAYLFAPVFAPVKAYFTSLDFSVNAESGCIEYSFTFTQAENTHKGCFEFGYTLAEAGENLFDIAARSETPIETVMDLNRFKNPFCVKEGDRVWLR